MGRIERALISVSEKKGIVEFSRALAELNIELRINRRHRGAFARQ